MKIIIFFVKLTYLINLQSPEHKVVHCKPARKTIERFVFFIKNNQFSKAYELLSDSLKTKLPYKQFEKICRSNKKTIITKILNLKKTKCRYTLSFNKIALISSGDGFKLKIKEEFEGNRYNLHDFLSNLIRLIKLKKFDELPSLCIKKADINSIVKNLKWAKSNISPEFKGDFIEIPLDTGKLILKKGSNGWKIVSWKLKFPCNE